MGRRRAIGLAVACGWLAAATLLAAEAPAADLATVPKPHLESLDAASRELVSSRRASLDDLVAEGSASQAALAASFGEMGRIYLLHDFGPAADACFTNAATLRPDDYRWHYYLALIDETGGRLDDAAAHLGRVVFLAPENLAARLRLGSMALARRRAQEAQRELSTALEISPGEEAARLGLKAAEAALAGDETDPPILRFADPLLDGLAQLAARLRVDAGIEALQRGETALAIERLVATLADSPNDWRALYHLGVARFRLGETESAIASVRRALELAPDFGEGHFSLASVFASLGRDEEARFHFERAYEADPKNSSVQLRWAQELAQSARQSEALPILESLVEREPNDLRAVTLLAEVLGRSGRPSEAAERLRETAELIEEGENRAVLYLQAGQLEDAAGRPAAAIEDLQRAVALAPGRVEVHAALAGTLARAGRFAEAAARFAEVVRVQPDAPAPRFSQALALLLAGRDEEARRVLEAAVAAMPDESSLLHLLARVLAASADDAVRDGGRALALARQVLAAESTVEHAETVAMALAEIGDFDEAVGWQERIVTNLGGPAAPGAAAAAARLALYRRGEPSRAPWVAVAAGAG